MNTLGFLARISPDGRYSIATVNEAIFVRNFTNYRFGQVFFPTRGVIAVYDTRDRRGSGTARGGPITEYVHCNAVWSPDGKTIIFSRAASEGSRTTTAKPQATYSGDPNETQIKYDLYRIPFNDGRGGVAEPIVGASANGMSNSFPKVSPDGKWIVWVKAKNGQLMRPRRQAVDRAFRGRRGAGDALQHDRMNSWHSFSPDGRWMVFSSKATDPVHADVPDAHRRAR